MLKNVFHRLLKRHLYLCRHFDQKTGELVGVTCFGSLWIAIKVWRALAVSKLSVQMIQQFLDCCAFPDSGVIREGWKNGK